MIGHAAGILGTSAAGWLLARGAAPWHASAWIVLVPWLLALDRTASWRAALVSGVAMAIAFSAAVFWWFPVAIADYAGQPIATVAALTVLAAPLFQPQFVAVALARQAARRRALGGGATAIVGAAVYVATEWAVPKLFGDTLAVGLFPSPLLRQGADVAGLAGLTFVVVLVNEAVARAVQAIARGTPGRALRPVAAVALGVGGVALYGALRTGALARVAADPPLTVGLVQANVAHYERLRDEVGTYEAVRRILDAHFALSDEVLARAPADLLVWAETVYPTTFGAPKSADGAAFDRAIGGFVARHRRPLLFGAYDAQDGREYNAAIVLEPGAGDDVTFEAYRKASLFPLTERVPAWLDGPRLRRWLPWLGSWQPGTGAAVLDVDLPDGRRLRVAPLICYDAVDPRNAARAVRDGASLIVTLSNDSWLDQGDGARLHFLVSAFRSIETRRPQVRVTTTGISAVLTATGEVVASAGVHERAGLAATVVPQHEPLPLSVRAGDWLPPLALVVALALLARGGDRAPGSC